MALRLTAAQFRQLSGEAPPAPRKQQRPRSAAPVAPLRGKWPRVNSDGDSLVFWFPSPGRAPTANDRGHWSDRSEAVAEWRGMSKLFARQSRIGRCDPSIVTALIPSLVRDASNLFVPCVKAIVDGCVDAGLWDDDDTATVYVAQPIVLPMSARTVGVAITPRDAGVEEALSVASRAAARVGSASTAA